MKRTLSILALSGLLVVPGVAMAQQREGVPPGVAAGAATGAVGGAIVGGPVGAAVGGVAGAVVGGISEATRPRFREYVVTRHHPSYRLSSDVEVGTELPSDGVTYYEVPRQFGEVRYRYTIINDQPVLVDPQTRRIVQIIE